jgi:F-type H+-transporting ATPase subunit alpha
MKETKKNWLDMFITENYQAGDKRVEGSVIKIADGVVTIRGLEEATAGEMLKINIVNSVDSKNTKKSLEVDFVYAMALNLNTDRVEAIILGDESKIKEGASAQLCRFPVQIPVSFNMLGRVVDPLGNFIDGKPMEKGKRIFKKVDIKAPGIIERQSVFESMQTGLKAIDSMVPIGRGQRELIIGDRQTGKTSVAIDAIINQKNDRSLPKSLKIFPYDLMNYSTEKQQMEYVMELFDEIFSEQQSK